MSGAPGVWESTSCASSSTRSNTATVRNGGRAGPSSASCRRRTKRGRPMLAIDYGSEGVVVIAGRLDAAQSPAAQTFFDQVQGPVTVDCSRLEYISSAGLGVL